MNLRFITFFLVLIYAVPAISETFEIVDVNGKVEISSDQKAWNLVKKGQVLASGTWLRTKSKASAVILLPDRTQTKISQNAEFQLNYTGKEEQTEVKLKLGKIWSKTNKKPIKIKVKAPNAVATIRGTEWVVEVSSDSSSTLAVLEGEINLKGDKSGDETIESGDVASISKDGEISVSKILNPAEYLQFVYNYKIQPAAYFPFIDVNQKSNASLQLEKSLNSGTDAKNCKFFNAGSPDIFFQNIANSSKECLLGINPERMSNSSFKDWATLIIVETNFALGDVDTGLAMLSLLPQSSAKSFVEAKYHFSNGKYNEAANILKTAKQTSANDAYFEAFLGEIEIAKSNLNAAKAYFSKANQLLPKWQMPLIRLAEIEISLGKYDAAKQLIVDAADLDAESSEVLAVDAQYLSYRYQLDEARKQSQLVVDANPNQIEMLVALGILELKAGNSELAIDYFTRATSIERNYAKAYVFMAVAHLHANEIEQALIQLQRAIDLDPNNSLPHVVSSQIYASKLNSEKSVYHAKEALKRDTGSNRYGQLSNDQQGGANVGRRFTEVGLPLMAREAANNVNDPFWAASHLFAAATATNSLEKNSEYMKGFTLDSQTFGSRRDQPDIISRPGQYGYREYRLGLGEENSDIGVKFGKNGKKIEGETETSFLYDVGVFGTERDAYIAADDTDTSKFALGFMGYGKRENFDKNSFVTANIIPFQTDGTFPVSDLTFRLDAGQSLREDSTINLYTSAVEAGSANVNMNVDGGCSGKDKVKTQAVELGYGELLQNGEMKNSNWFAETAIRSASSKFDVTGAACSDLSDLIGGNYSVRDEDIDSLEYEITLSFQQEFNTEFADYDLKLNTGYYHHEFDQTIITDGNMSRDFKSDKHDYYFKPSFGLKRQFDNFTLRVAGIIDRYTLRQAPLNISALGGLSTHFEFVNTGGEINQFSTQFIRELDKNKNLSVIAETFTVKNNPLYLTYREQWNADLLENFTLDKFYNVNSQELFNSNNDFASAKFERLSFVSEQIVSSAFMLRLGIEYWDAKERDHPKFLEPETLGRVKGVPEASSFAGFTRTVDELTTSLRVVNNENIHGSDNQIVDQTIIQGNAIRPFMGGEVTFDVSIEPDETETLKTILLFRNYF